MPKEREYDVRLIRIGHATRTFTVKARNRSEAHGKALAIAPNEVFREHDSDYKVDSVVRTEGPGD